ncbi:hypothetical protein Sjap_025420 [Stephania japonica]|uniref:non-specific serine/threonine protein kinase n=1 Tax=Stephania japonica TaxID=461633 RepID=A0AAP0E1P6_9MAGN
MKTGMNLKSGLKWSLTSWKSPDDPSTGEFSYSLARMESPEMVLKKASQKVWRPGPWNGQAWNGVPGMSRNYLFNYSFVNSPDEIYFIFSMYNASIINFILLNDQGIIKGPTWVEGDHRWNNMRDYPGDRCEYYGKCGAFGSCNSNNGDICSCLPGYEPKSPRDWYIAERSKGCVRKRELLCGKGDGFLKLEKRKFPDTSNARVYMSLGIADCEIECRKNCSCTGYASAYVDGSGCLAWFGDLIDIAEFTVGGQDLFVRVDAIELGDFFAHQLCLATDGTITQNKFLIYRAPTENDTIAQNKFLRDGETIVTNGGIYALGFFSPANSQKRYVGIWLNKVSEQTVVWVANRNNPINNSSGVIKIDDRGNLAIFNGNSSNPVWSNNVPLPSRFIYNMNSSTLLYQLLDTGNLVLIQENKVDFLWESFYDPTDSRLYGMKIGLNLQSGSNWSLTSWKSRDDPSTGDFTYSMDRTVSPEMVIKKASQKIWRSGPWIDQGWNGIPNMSSNSIFNTTFVNNPDETYTTANNYNTSVISRFYLDELGFTRISIWLEDRKKWSIVWSAPGDSCDDYGKCGAFGSFEELLQAWKLWRDGRPLELVDRAMGTSFPEQEAVKFIQVGILCVQENADDRPTMSTVIFMLSNDTTIPIPEQPAFILTRNYRHPNSSTSGTGSCSVNEMSTTIVEGR